MVTTFWVIADAAGASKGYVTERAADFAGQTDDRNHFDVLTLIDSCVLVQMKNPEHQEGPR